MAVMKDGGTLLPPDNAGHVVATESQIAEIRQHIEKGLAAGALGVGMGLQYTPAASKYEVLEDSFSVCIRPAITIHRSPSMVIPERPGFPAFPIPGLQRGWFRHAVASVEACAPSPRPRVFQSQ